MRSRISFAFIVASAVFAGTGCAPGEGPADAPLAQSDLAVSLQSEQVAVWRDQPISMSFELANTSKARLMVLAYQTPLAGIEADLFEVTRDGQPVPYTGKLVKRAAPEADDYVAVEAGQTVRGAFDPSTAYDMSRPGHYEVRYRAPALQVVVPEQPNRVQKASVLDLSSNALALWFEGVRLPKARKPPSNDPFAGCSETQKTSLMLARTNATTISGKARSYLADDPQDSGEIYKTWFDASGDRQGWSTVATHFDAIHDAFVGASVTYNCKCKQKVYAFVYPNQPYKITVCSIFWIAPDVGTDSKAGTLVHEMSHFNVVASTDDWAYGTAAAMNLAQTDVSRATTNADNHEYFAESQP